MPHVSLKVLRGEQDEEDVQDKYFERFKPPPTTTDEDDDNSDSDDIIDGNDNDVIMRSWLTLHGILYSVC